MTDGDHEELLRLRDWRHEVVTPALAAAGALLKAHEDRLSAIEPRVAALARADEIADAVAAKMTSVRRSLFTTTEKVGAFIVGAVSVAALVSQWLH